MKQQTGFSCRDGSPNMTKKLLIIIGTVIAQAAVINGGGGIKCWWPSSVCMPVCPMPDPKQRMEGHSKLKIGRKSHVEWPVTPFRGRKVKGKGNKVTSLISFTFEVWSEAQSWWCYLMNKFTNIGRQCQKNQFTVQIHIHVFPLNSKI